MQKARAIRNAKRALEDAFNDMNGVIYGSSTLNVFPHHWEINVYNRDRPGGHISQDMKGWYGFLKSKTNKRMATKQLRKQQRKATSEALADYEWDHAFYLYPYGTDYLEYDSLQEQFMDEERERQSQLLREYNGGCYMEDYEDDMSYMDWDDRLYDDILDDYYGEIR